MTSSPKPMALKEIATFEFRDHESNDDALVILRATNTMVAIGISLRSNGDLDILLEKKDCERLLAALRKAVEFA